MSRYSMKSINNASLAFSKYVRIDFLIGINGQGLKTFISIHISGIGVNLRNSGVFFTIMKLDLWKSFPVI